MAKDARRRKPKREEKGKNEKLNGTEKPHEESSGRANYCLVIFGLLACFTIFTIYKCHNSPISPEIVDLQDLDWPFGINDDLKNGKKLHKNLVGPESIAMDENNNLYTGLKNGKLIKIRCKANGDMIEESDAISEINHSPAGQRSRILGIRYRSNKLYYADAFRGIFTIDLTNNKVEKLVGNNDVNPPMKFADDLVVTSDGKTIYFTDASSRWGYDDVSYSVLEGECTGRVFRLNLITKQVDVLLKDLCFANGIQLNSDETQIVLAETTRYRVKIIDLNSQKVSKTIFLPGGPDNIRSSLNNGYWVAIPQLRDTLSEWLMKYPSIRATLASFFSPRNLLKAGDFSKGIIIKLNEDGEIVKVMYDLGGSVASAVTQVTETKNGKLLLGSFIHPGIAQIDL